MGVKAIIEAEADVPDALKDFYKADEKGKFVLDIEGIDDHPRVRGVITANRENVKKRDEYKAKVTELESKVADLPEDFDPDKWIELKKNAGDPNDPDKKKKDDEHLQSQRELYERRLDQQKKKFETQIAERDTALGERDGYIDKVTKLDVLRKSLREVGVDPDFEDVVVDHLSPSIKVQRLDNGDRKPIVETDMGEVDVSSFVKDWTSTKGQKFLGKASGPDPKGGQNQRSGAKTISRSEFDKLDPAGRMKSMQDQVAVVD